MNTALDTYNKRKDLLNKLLKTLYKLEPEILEALKQDLNKSAQEAHMTEIGVLKDEIEYILKHLKRWMKPQKAKTSLKLFPAKCYRVPEPYGRVLIMSPWNYPLLLTLEPLCGAIAAGNTAVIKPSAYSPATSEIIAKIVAETFPEEICRVIQGGREANQELLNQRFDYIFFTGSPSVGKEVMKKAAEHLTPVSLELGGKSPVIIAKDADLDLTARRIVFGKFMNAGQTCVAPDYVMVPSPLEPALIEKLNFWIEKFYPINILEASIMPKGNDYVHIINTKHFDRLRALLPKGNDKERIVIGGKYNPGSLHIEPTVITNVDFDSRIMEEEIFGPLLPIIAYDDFDEMLSTLKSREKPLALYLFTKSTSIKKQVLSEISFGGGCINDTLIHVGTSDLPFGGVGNSGMGAYHGKASFDTFTHYKSIVDKGAFLDPFIRNRPYSDLKLKLLKKI